MITDSQRSEIIFNAIMAVLYAVGSGWAFARTEYFAAAVFAFVAACALGAIFWHSRHTWSIPHFSVHVRTFTPRLYWSRLTPQTTVGVGYLTICLYHRR